MQVMVCALSFCLRVSAPRHPFAGILQSSLPSRFRSLRFRMVQRVRRFFNDLTAASIRKKDAEVNENGKCFHAAMLRLFKV